MTTKNFGMMVIGMMLIGTTTVFGKTNTTVHNDRRGTTRTEVIVINNHDKGMGRMMDRHMVNHILDGRHFFNHHGDCKVCHMNRREIMKVERRLRSNSRPMAKPNHFVR